MPVLMQGQKGGSPFYPHPFGPRSPSLQRARVEEGRRVSEATPSAQGSPRRAAFGWQGLLRLCRWSGGHTPGAGERPEQHHRPGSSFVVAFGCGVEGKDLGTKPSGQEDKGDRAAAAARPAGPIPTHSNVGDTGVSPRRGERRWQGVSRVRSPPPGAAPPGVFRIASLARKRAAHCSSSHEGFSAPGGLSLMLNCCSVCSSCFWFPAK